MVFKKNDNRLYSYVIGSTDVSILNPAGSIELKASRNPTGGEWTEVEKIKWADGEVLKRNTKLATDLIKSKIAEVSKEYDAAMISTVTLSDGNVFGPSKSSGENPTYSLQNTVDLIRAGAEHAVFRGRTEITVSDMKNNPVTYQFDLESKFPSYILPVVEIADYIAVMFSVKQTIRATLLGMLEQTEFSFDEVEAINGRELFTAQVASILAK